MPESPSKPVDFLSLDKINKMPDGLMKKTAIQIFNNYRQELLDYKNECENYQAIKEAIENKDGDAAYNCLLERRGR